MTGTVLSFSLAKLLFTKYKNVVVMLWRHYIRHDASCLEYEMMGIPSRMKNCLCLVYVCPAARRQTTSCLQIVTASGFILCKLLESSSLYHMIHVCARVAYVGIYLSVYPSIYLSLFLLLPLGT
jgi:hypothetical protein